MPRQRGGHRRLKTSIAGLASARVCHDHFERVVIVEPEDWLSSKDAWTENVQELQYKRSRLMQWDSYQGVCVCGLPRLP